MVNLLQRTSYGSGYGNFLDEDVAYTGFLIGSDLDLDDVLNYFIVTQPLNGTITQSTELDSNFIYTPYSNYFGGDLFTFVAYDDSVYSDTAIVSILVHPINDAPVVDIDSMVYLLEDGDVFYQMNGTDVDDDNLTFFQVEGPFHGDYDVATNIYTPFPNYFGSDMFTYIAMDTSGFESELATVTFNIEAVDDPPFVDSYLDTIYLVEDFQDPISYELDSMFTDIDGLLTYAVQLADPSVVSASVWGGGRLVLVSIPDANGMTEMIITASNPTRASVSDTVMVMVDAVNDMPVVIVSDTSMYEDGHLAIQVQASDIDGDDIHYLDVHFDPEVVDGYFFGGDSLMIHSIVEHWNGSVSVHVEVGDGDFVVHEHFTVSVLPVNDAPYFVSPMHAPVGLGLEFDLPLHIMDVDSQSLI